MSLVPNQQKAAQMYNTQQSAPFGPGIVNGVSNVYRDPQGNFAGIGNTPQTGPAASVNPVPAYSSAPTGGGGGGGNPVNTGPQSAPNPLDMGDWQNQQRVSQYENQVRSDINSGYDAYTSSLDQMLGGIPQQQAGQNQIVENNYNQGISDLGAQKASSLGDLNTQRRKTGEGQVKSLNDISDNIRNLFQAGNVMLGARGAGDSSAANQYSYAVTKLGAKQRGDVMAQTRSIESDIQDRESKLNNIVTQETGKLKTNRDNQVLQIAQYFQDAQNQLLQAKAQGQLQRGQSLAQLSTQLLQNAQAQLMQADANYKTQQNSLLQWAESNSKNIGQLKSNLAQLGQYNAPAIQTQAINGQPQFGATGGLSSMFGGAGGFNDDERSR